MACIVLRQHGRPGSTRAHHNDDIQDEGALATNECHAPSTLQLSVTALHSFLATRPSSLSRLLAELCARDPGLQLLGSTHRRSIWFPLRGGPPTHFQHQTAHPPDPTDRDRATGGMEIVLALDTVD